jgi:outer membrane receptor protein involved in Fe transport
MMLASASTLFAQNVGKISGVVRDAATGETLPGCNVIIVGTTLGGSSDPEGTYFILNVTPGKYDVQASLVGYQNVVQRGVIVNGGKTTTVDFRLSSTELMQQEVVIEATRPDVEREKTSTSAIIRSDEVQAVAGMRSVGDLLLLTADINDGHFRGGRAGEEYYTLQGLGIVNPLDNSSAFLPIMSSVEEVEVITSGFGAQYGNAQSGVVNISMKEGKSDRWTTTADSRVRVPGRKHFGPSVFDPGGNPYLALLLNSDVWLHGDPNAETQQPYFGSMGSGLTSRFARDTLVQLAVAQALYLQTRRDLNRNYGKEVDYSVEAATGGPISESMRMFIALRSNTEWPVFPTEQPDVERQVMGNVVIDLPASSALRISGGFSLENNNGFPGQNGVSGYQRWLWDRISGISYQKRTNLQLGVRFTQTLSSRTFYELKVNSLFTHNKVGSTPVPGGVPDSASAGGPAAIAWSFILPVQNNNSPDGLDYQTGYDQFRNEPTRTVTFDGSLTSQITNSHLVNAGVQFNTYLIDISNHLQLRNNNYFERYKATPFDGALYIQDKMEFEGMIANVGLRWDAWRSGRDYYTDLYLPFGMSDTNGMFHSETASRASTPILARLQPRVGVSFPVSVNTVFHLNYGSFMQRPQFRYIVASRVVQGVERPVILGNPRLKPEVTNSYDIGVTQGLGEGFTLDVSGYYKDVKDLVGQAAFEDIRTGLQDSSYFNIAYADIRGFRVALSKRRGAFTGSINYQFGVATGKSATVTGAVPLFSRDTTGAVATDLSNVPVRDILLDFDRTHNLVINLAYATGEEWGPELFETRLLADVTISAQSFVRSGRPYTSPKNLKVINGSRAPGEFETNLKVMKKVRNFFGTTATFYAEVFNLFNNKTLNYDYIFRKPTATNPNLTLSYYEDHPIDDRDNGVRYWWDRGRQGIFAVDQSFLIYSNQPRSFSFGLALEL